MNIEDFKERLKNGEITHSGGLHLDEVFATIMIFKWCDLHGIKRPEVTRISDFTITSEDKETKLLIDVGKGDLDHHQANNPNHPGTEIPYAATGKVFDLIGGELFGEHTDTVLKELILPIDLCDTTATKMPFYTFFSNMNPNWNEKGSTDEAFKKSLELAEKMFDDRIEMIKNGYRSENNGLMEMLNEKETELFNERQAAKDLASKEAIETIEKAIKNAIYTYGPDGKEYGIISFDRPGIPFPVIKKMTAGTRIFGYTFPQRGALSYKPLDKDDEKLNIPTRWRGSSADNLSREVNGLTFCHAGGISLSFENMNAVKEGFYRMLHETYISNCPFDERAKKLEQARVKLEEMSVKYEQEMEDENGHLSEEAIETLGRMLDGIARLSKEVDFCRREADKRDSIVSVTVTDETPADYYSYCKNLTDVYWDRSTPPTQEEIDKLFANGSTYFKIITKEKNIVVSDGKMVDDDIVKDDSITK